MASRKSFTTYYGFIFVKKINGTICGRFPVTKKECTLGRGSDCDIRILLDSVSALHCSILYIDDKAYIRDKSITGSTKVNGKNIGRNNFLLHHSDEIDICGRKFVWEYAKSFTELNSSKSKKSEINSYATSRISECSTQVNTPLVPQDNNKISFTPAKSNTKTPSKTLISLNKTPIVTAAKNMSKLSFEELKNSIKKQNSTTISESEPRIAKSFSMVSGRNIPLISDTKSAQRKSWVVTNSSDNLSSNGACILDRLSCERLKRDSTPEFNSSYHYDEENVQFDSPEPHCMTSDTKLSIRNIDLNSNSRDNSPNSTNCLNDEDMQSNISQNNLLESELEHSTSRRDTYSIANGPIIVEQIATPTPRRSILKCSKTAQTNRSRSNCRMVQFARLPKTDSKIKLSKSHFNSGSKFVVTDDKANETDLQDSRKSIQFNVEEYDDDLDGVQPLDSSVASLINSPILENSTINKSSKRGSRGNKVMSLINSIEKNVNKSPKHSIRASDLLSVSGSKHVLDTSPKNNTQMFSSILEESASSSRRINLENIFEAEDSLKNTPSSCNIENKTMVSELDGSKTTNINDHVIANLEQEYNFSSPLNLPINSSPKNGSSISISNSTFMDIKNDENNVELINSIQKSETNIIEYCITPKTDNSPSDNESKKTSNFIENNCSQPIDTTKEICTDDLKTHNNVSALLSKPTSNESCNLSVNSIKKENLQKSVSKSMNGSKITDLVNDEESPSMVIQCMSEMFNTSINDTPSRPKCENSLVESYELVEKDDKTKINLSFDNNVKISSNEINDTLSNESATSNQCLNKSLVDAIEVKLDILHGGNNLNEETVLVDSMSKTSNNKTKSFDFVSDNVETLIHTSNQTQNSVSDTNTSNTVSKAQSFVKNNSFNNDSNDINLDGSNLPVKIEATTASVRKTRSSVGSNSSVITNNKTISCNDELTYLPYNLVSINKDVRQVQCSPLNSVHKSSSLNSSNKSSKSRRSIINSPNIANVTNNEIATNKVLVKVIDISLDDSDNDENNGNIDKTNKNLEKTLNTSIGKPQYESTPWNSSKNSKVNFDSASNEQIDTTTHNDYSSKNVTCENTKKRSISPDPNLEEWSQMMIDFNESVKKASGSMNCFENVKTVTKTLFDQAPGSSLTVKNNLSSTYTNIDDNTSKINKKKTKSSFSSNNALKLINEKSTRSKKRLSKDTNNSEVSTSNSNACQEISTSKTSSADAKTSINKKKKSETIKTNSNVKKIKLVESPQVETSFPVFKTGTKHPVTRRKLNQDMTDSEPDNKTSDKSESNNNNSKSLMSLSSSDKTKKLIKTKKINSSPTFSTRRNLRVRSYQNESTKSQMNSKVNVTEETSTNSGTDTNSSESSKELKIPKKKLRNKMQNLDVEETKPTIRATVKQISKKSTLITETRSGKTKLTEKSEVMPLTKTRFTRSSTTLTDIRVLKLGKKNKSLSPVDSIKSKVEKTKKTKSSKFVKKNQPKRLLPSNPIKLNNSSSEDESMSETEENLSKSTNVLPKRNNQPNNISLPSKRNLKKKVEESTPNISTSLRTRGCKRVANTAISQPNAKGQKRDNSDKVASTTMSSVSNSSSTNSSCGKKRTRNASKLAEKQDSNNSFSETLKKKDKPKSILKTRAKKREFSEDSSDDSAPSSKKLTRQAANKEIKNNSKSASASTRTKVQNTDESSSSSSTKVTLNKNVDVISSSKSKKTRNTTQEVTKAKIEPIPPRVLRTRDKKK